MICCVRKSLGEYIWGSPTASITASRKDALAEVQWSSIPEFRAGLSGESLNDGACDISRSCGVRHGHARFVIAKWLERRQLRREQARRHEVAGAVGDTSGELVAVDGEEREPHIGSVRADGIPVLAFQCRASPPAMVRGRRQ
jgi:hypothetical protein